MDTNESKMNMTSCWNGFAASIPGGGHIRHGIPCQDASAVMTAPRPALIVCDGRGSASLSHFGAEGAVKAFRSQVSILEPFLVNILDGDEENTEQWTKFCRIMYRTLMQVKYELAEKHNTQEKEFDFTVAFAIAGRKHIGCFQVGDGSLVLRQNGVCQTVFPPEKGEFANQTHFLRPGGEVAMSFQHALFDAEANSGIAATSDGPEHLMFHLADMKPGRIFDMLLDDLLAENLTKQDIMDYLTRKEWANDPRGADDRSLAVLACVKEEAITQPEEECAESAPDTKADAVESEEAAKPEAEAAEPEEAEAAEPEAESAEPEAEAAEPEEAESAEPEAEADEPEAEAKDSDAPGTKKGGISMNKEICLLAIMGILSSAVLVEAAYLARQQKMLTRQMSAIRNIECLLADNNAKPGELRSQASQPVAQEPSAPKVCSYHSAISNVAQTADKPLAEGGGQVAASDSEANTADKTLAEGGGQVAASDSEAKNADKMQAEGEEHEEK